MRTDIYWGLEYTTWADVAIFHPVDNNLKQASKKQEKPANTFILAEAVDIDIYSNHLGGVNWDYVDALVFMSEHMKEYAEQRFNLPDSLPRYIVPGGIDLEKFTFRNQPRGYNVAWVGRLWIAKNIFSALQIFNQLVKLRPWEPWRLFIRDDRKWHPPTWWRRHCEAYLEANPGLRDRVMFTEPAPDMNAWLEDKDYLLQTSYKEAFGYVVGEAAAKGIKPVVQMTLGADEIWEPFVFQTHQEAIEMFLGTYDPMEYRAFVQKHYPLEKRIQLIEEICGIR